ncbi:MAG TPA: DUF58 domain-containing protein [Vicinamibacterales bacterium]
MASEAPARSAHLLDPAVIARLGSMELKARTIVEGLLLGLHRSPYRGFSAEFAEYRQYIVGDDPSWVDWKVYARSDRYYVRKFEAETNLECNVLLDASASMGYGSGAMTKLQYGACLAAAIAWLVSGQRDAVGLTAFDEKIRLRIPPRTRTGHLHLLLVELERLQASAGSNVAKPLQQLADALDKRGMVVLISDLIDDPAEVVKGLKFLHARGMDVAVFHLLDQAELTFPFERAMTFRDLESAEEILAVPEAVRAHYLEQLEALTGHYRNELRLAGIDYTLLSTATPLDVALLSYLHARGRRH